jgi:hypothetical protein
MKKSFFRIFLVLTLAGTSLAGAFIEYFHARSEGENVKLEWKSGNETNLKYYVIERKTQQSSFVDLATITSKGSNSVYTFIDESVYKSNDYVFTYRLRLVDNDQSVSYYDHLASVSPNISGVKRTWGSIKAMFR